MRPASCLLLLALAAACADSSPGPTILAPQQPIPFVPPQVTAVNIVGVGGPVAAVGAASTWDVIGQSLNLKLDGSDPPGISLTRTRDLSGNPASGPILSAKSVKTLGVQGGTGTGSVEFVIEPSVAGIYDLKLTTAAGSTNVVDTLVIVPQLEVASLPDQLFFCGSDPVAIALDGTFTQLPRFELFGAVGTQLVYVDAAGNELTNDESWPVQLDGCTTVPFNPYPGVQVCHRATIVPNANSQHAVVQVNSLFGITPKFDVFFEFSRPDVGGGGLQVYSAAAVPTSLRFNSDVLVDGSAGPIVTLDGSQVPSTMANCAPSGFAGKQVCGTVETALPQGTPPGLHKLTATSLFGCTSSISYQVHAPPAITSVSPSLVCLGANPSVTVSGTDFGFPTLLLDGQPASTLCNDAGCSLSLAGVPAGVHQIAVRGELNVSVDSQPVSVTVHPGPVGFSGEASPATLLAGAGRTTFIPVRGQEGALISTEFRENLLDGGVMPVAFEEVDGGVVVTTPADAGPGRYVVGIADEGACQPSQSIALVDLVQSPATYDYEFTDGGAGFQFGVLAANGIFTADTNLSLTQGGNPGGALAAQFDAGTASHHFQGFITQFGNDLGSLQFDLSTCGAGGTVRGDVVELVGSEPLTGDVFFLTHPIDAPSCALTDAFTHYDLPLDASWTRTDASGSRPAQRADFIREMDVVRIPGVFSDAAGITFLDNVVVDLAQ